MEELIKNIFNLNEEEIEILKTLNENEELIVRIKLKKKELYCPTCGRKLIGNGTRLKEVKHQVLTGKNMKLIYEARRYRCTKCGYSQYERNPFSIKGFQTSILVMDQIMNDLHNPRLNYSTIAQRNGVSVNQVINYLDSYVVIPHITLPVNLGIDEIYSNMAKRRDASYLGVLTDNDKFNLIDILTSRNTTDLNNFFQKYTKEERDNVLYVTIDMWEPYEKVAQKWLKNAIVAVDPFHVISHLTTCFDKVRLRIMRSVVYKSSSYYLLKKWNKLLMSDKYNLDGERIYNHVFHTKLNYGDLLEMILDISDELRLAYNLKELYRRFNKGSSFENAENELDILIAAFQKSNIKEYDEFVSILIKWKQEIINSFIISDFTGHRLSNAKAESMNNNIGTNINISNGLANYSRFRKRMLYCYNDNVYYALSSNLVSLKRKMK